LAGDILRFQSSGSSLPSSIGWYARPTSTSVRCFQKEYHDDRHADADHPPAGGVRPVRREAPRTVEQAEQAEQAGDAGENQLRPVLGTHGVR
jgi:hypothetical protein